MKIPIWHKGELYGHAQIDEEDYPHINNYKWCANINPHGNFLKVYAYAYINKKMIYLHRLLMSPSKGMVVDHLNHDGLDNRKSNLRICTQRENASGKRRRRAATS